MILIGRSMKIFERIPPRKFGVGKSDITLSDTGSIFLDSNEQVTFKDSSGREYDVCKKEWGYYATPSVNGRLKKFRYKTALVENIETGMKYVMLVEDDKQMIFEIYLVSEGLKVNEWLV